MTPEEQQAFMAQAAQDVNNPAPAPAATPAEPQFAYEGDAPADPTPAPAPAPEPTPDPNAVITEQMAAMEAKMKALSDENSRIKYDAYQSTQTPLVEEPVAEGAMPDPYGAPEQFQAWLDKKSEAAAGKAVQKTTERLQAVEMIQGQNLWEQGVKDCKAQFEGFDIQKEGTDLQKIMQAKNVSLVEAKKLKEFDRMQDQLKQFNEGNTERLNNPQMATTNTATRTQQDPATTITLPALSADEKAFASRSGRSEKEYALMKYKADQWKGQMPA